VTPKRNLRKQLLVVHLAVTQSECAQDPRLLRHMLRHCVLY